jgi:DNA ligase (NAD+)
MELFNRPETCPFCGKALVIRKAEHEVLACVNPECKTQIGDRLVRFVTVGGMGIPGITENVVEQLLLEGKLDTVEGLYSLTVKDFMDACHVSYTDAYVLMKSVERSKLKPMHMLLDAMGIPGISREVTPILAACIAGSGGMGALVDSDPLKMAKAVAKFTARAVKAGFTGKAAQGVVDYFFKYREMVLKLVELGVAQEATPVEWKEKPKRTRGKRMKRRKPRKKPGADNSKV